MKKVVVLGVGTLLIGASVVAPSWFGDMAEEEMDRAMVELQASQFSFPGVSFRLDSYEKGWFSSTSQTVMTIDLNAFMSADGQNVPSEPIEVVIGHVIKHGPFIGSQVGAAKIVSSLVTSSDNAEIVAHYFGEMSPVEQTTIIQFDGDMTVRLQVPEFTGRDHTDSVDIEWGGVDLLITSQLQGQKFIYDMTMPQLKIRDDEGELFIRNMTLQGDMSDEQSAMFLGGMSWMLEEVSFNRSRADLPNVNFSLLGAKLDVLTDQEGSLIRVSEVISFQRLKINDEEKAGPGVLELELRNLNADSLMLIQKKSQEMQGSQATPEEISMAVMIALSEYAPALLKSSPQLELSKFELSMDKGNVKGSLLLSFNGDGDYDLQVLPSLISMITLNVKANISSDILKMILAEQIRNDIIQQNSSMSADELDQQVTDLVNQQLMSLQASNIIIEADGSHRLSFQFKDSKAMLNGELADHLLAGLPIQ